jgi:phosphoglycerate kinase
VIHLPDTVVVEAAGQVDEVAVTEVSADARIMDVGGRTLQAWRPIVLGLGRLFWNGPMGLYERPPFDHGTATFARTVGEMAGLSVVGGGDSLAAIRRLGLEGAISHLSTGGGASLTYLEGEILPGLQALEER